MNHWTGTSGRLSDVRDNDVTREGLPLGKVFAKTDQQYGEKWTGTASHELLEMLAQSKTFVARRLCAIRPLLAHAIMGERIKLEKALAVEESGERERDRAYWLPLRAELEKLRHSR